ncbi:hypothetical protein K1719_017853 [Acacia pycnantha]|nr:hypothetical protein K1719_017853 [Acacia pycnantha]
MSRKLNALSSLKAELEIMDQSEFPAPQSCCIYRVPPELREVNEAAYTPVMVSIGPFHRGNKRLNSLEEVKLWFLYKFLKRTQDRSFDDYVCVLGNQEIKIRRCYSEIIPTDNDEFIRMILTDACFMIEYFLLWLDEDRWNPKLWSMQDIDRDLILLENQLPFFVLKDLFGPTFPNGYNDGIKFVVNEDEISLLKLQYSKGVLKIPKFMIIDSTETHLRNVVAFKQCQFPSSRSMTDYMVFWEHFIRTEKDVEILEENGVIQNLVGGNDAVASIIKRLGRHTASILGTIVLLVLTLIQTISSVIVFLQN